jgi:Guanine nucleotide exchange factor in Golgi transport N-terminal
VRDDTGLDPAARDASAIFEDLCLLLGSGARPQQVDLDKTFTLMLINRVLTNYHQLFRKVCLSSFLPIRDLYAGSCPQFTTMFTSPCYNGTPSPLALK